ncbi:hypothetical protein PGT21_003531 [Puccinia graminis f. sp. tritici]|uniref:Uncharacterized protein n=1 Tax=Puccinia graminis f. sp. tritici TaxID=56615 RepID=A0A5B0NBG1_PUCGR|nr:hypothetical protein PGT21_003531 [Puccinia graminis f. sp. tritici]
MFYKLLTALVLLGRCFASESIDGSRLVVHEHKEGPPRFSEASNMDHEIPADSSLVKEIERSTEESDYNTYHSAKQNFNRPTTLGKKEEGISGLSQRNKSTEDDFLCSSDINTGVIVDENKQELKGKQSLAKGTAGEIEGNSVIELDSKINPDLIWEQKKRLYKATTLFLIFYYSMLASIYYSFDVGSRIFK